MTLSSFSIYRVRIPFKIAFGHAKASRERSDSVIVRLLVDDGTVGYGECAPREYVTGETADTVFAAIESQGPALASDLAAAEDPIAFLRDRLPELLQGNAARCAFELAALDLISKQRQQPIPVLLARSTAPDFRPRYSGVIGSGPRSKIAWSALKMRAYGFRDVKIKVGASLPEDVQTAATARFMLRRATDLRADANGVWTMDDAERTLDQLSPFRISCIEQPLPKDKNEALPLLRRRVAIPIMLDESLCTMEDARRAVEHGECDLFNIRVSKCGGLIGSLAMADYADANRIRCQLGCQVGETGILSAAGRWFSAMVPGLVHLEGSYERHLLRDDITHERVRFGYGGWADLLPAPGLGVSVNEEALERYTERISEVQV